jgi:hypothetical protein
MDETPERRRFVEESERCPAPRTVSQPCRKIERVRPSHIKYRKAEDLAQAKGWLEWKRNRLDRQLGTSKHCLLLAEYG